jgi:hypothetical protein
MGVITAAVAQTNRTQAWSVTGIERRSRTIREGAYRDRGIMIISGAVWCNMLKLARILISIVAAVTLVGSNIADWNSTHIFSELWSPHAHFHGAWFVVAISLLSLLCLWLVWSPAGQVDRARTAALIQGGIWLAFFPAMLVPDTALADPGKQLAQIAGVELNLVGAVGNVALLAVALALLQRSRRAERAM